MVFASTPLWLDFGLLLAACIAAFEGGRWLGGWLLARAPGTASDTDAASGSGESHALSGVFGLLALLLAFSFGMALDRFEQRRTLVVAEANAMSTLDSRLALLANQDQAQVRALLAEYGRARLAFGAATSDAASIAASEAAEQVHARLGSAIYAALARSAPDPRGPAILQPFNDMGDIAAARTAEREAHLPSTVLVLLALFCVAGAAMLGYSRAGNALAHRPASILFLALLATAFIAILDLDRPRDGSITVRQDAMERQVAALQAAARAATAP